MADKNYGDISLNGTRFRIDAATWREKDIIDFAPRATVPGGSVVMSDLGLYQPLVQTDWRHGFGFQWYEDSQGYLQTNGRIDTRHADIAMMFTNSTASDTNDAGKSGFTIFDGKVWAWGACGIRYFDTSWHGATLNDIDFDAASKAGSPGATILTFNHTVATSGTDRILIVFVGVQDTTAVSGITYNGVALTKLSASALTTNAELWYLLDPATGDNDVEITMAGSCAFAAGAVSYLYVDQSTPFGTPSSGSDAGAATTGDMSLTSAVGELALSFLVKRGPSTDNLAAASGQNLRFLKSVSTTTVQGAGSDKSGAASVTLRWNWTNSRAFSFINVALKPSTTATSSTVNYALSAGTYLFYAPDGLRLRKIHKTTLADSVAGLDSNAKDFKWLVIHNGYIYAGVDGKNHIHYDSNDDLSQLEGTTADTNVIYVGVGDMPTLGGIVYAGTLYVARADGLWSIGDDKVARRVIDYSNEMSDSNFASMVVCNGYLIFPIRDTVRQWNGARVQDITPQRLTDTFPYTTYSGFDNFVSADNFLYCTARTNDATPIVSLLCWDGVVWHKLADLTVDGTSLVTAMGYDPINYYLWYHVDATPDVTYYIQQNGGNSYPYSNFPTTGTHSLISSRLDMGFRRIKKSLPSCIIEASNLDDGTYLSVYYQIDGSGTWVKWADVKNSGVTILNNPGGNKTIEFYYMLLRVDFTTDTAAQSPILEGVTLRFIMRPNVLWGYSFYVLAGTSQIDGEREDERTSAEIRDQLLALRDSKAPITMVDMIGRTHTGYITAVQGQPTMRTPNEEETDDVEMRYLCNFASLEGET